MAMTSPTPAGPDVGGPGRGSLVLLVGAGVLVVVVVGAVLVFGVQRPPPLASVADEPLPDDTPAVSWTRSDDAETCLVVVRADGRRDEPWCSRSGGDVIAWPDAGIEVLQWESGQTVLTIDPASGEVRSRDGGDVAGPGPPEGPGQLRPVRTEYREGVLEVRLDADEEVLWRVEAPDVYDVHEAAVSPDGRWVALADSARRLLVAPADGSTAPRVWATDVDRWRRPVWEGTPRDADHRAR